MKHLSQSILFLLFFSFAGAALAQSPEAESERSSRIVDHIRDVDLLNKILPIVWTKAELNAVLPEIEKVRKKVNETHHQEYLTLAGLDAKVSAAMDKALNDGNLPGKELMNELEGALDKMALARTAIGRANEDNVYTVVAATLNVGQKKAMANALDPGLMSPNLRSEKMTDEEKIRFFIRNILLDPLAYDLLVKLSMSSSTPDK